MHEMCLKVRIIYRNYLTLETSFAPSGNDTVISGRFLLWGCALTQAKNIYVLVDLQRFQEHQCSHVVKSWHWVIVRMSRDGCHLPSLGWFRFLWRVSTQLPVSCFNGQLDRFEAEMIEIVFCTPSCGQLARRSDRVRLTHQRSGRLWLLL